MGKIKAKHLTTQLIQRLKRDLNVEVENVQRTYAGRNMKAAGANVWNSNVVNSHYEVGSPHPITKLLKANKIILTEGWSGGQSIIEISDNQ